MRHFTAGAPRAVYASFAITFGGDSGEARARRDATRQHRAALGGVCGDDGLRPAVTSSTPTRLAPRDADPKAPLVFESGRGYQITLNRAVLHVGGVYLDRTLPVSGAQDTSCVLPGSYVGEATTGLDVDTLSPTLQPFPDVGEGTETQALAGEVWLTGGDVNSVADATTILDVSRGRPPSKTALDRVRRASSLIGENRAETPTDPSLPGSVKPIHRKAAHRLAPS